MTASARPSGRSSRVDYRALAEFRYQLRCFLRAGEQAARDAGLEPQQHQLLLSLRGAPPGTAPTVGWLAERLQVAPHSAVGLVDRLEANHLVRRRRDRADGRRALIAITAAGERILRDLSVFHRDELRTRAPYLIEAISAVVQGGDA